MFYPEVIKINKNKINKDKIDYKYDDIYNIIDTELEKEECELSN
jgi:hypothetical protein